MDLKNIPVDYVLKAVNHVKKLAYLIAVIGAVTSFGTQVELLKTWHLSVAFAVGIALTVDLLAICAAIALKVPGLPQRERRQIGFIMFFTLAVSIAANMIAGFMESVGAAIGHAWPVLAYMLAEFIANALRRFVATVQGMQAQQVTPAQTPSQPVQATATVTKTPPVTISRKPISAKAQILALAAVTPPLSPDQIAAQVGTKPAWVKHVIKTAATSTP